MPSEQLSNIIELLRANQVVDPGTVHDMRARIESFTAPVDPHIETEVVDAGGVPSEWVRGPGVRDDAAMLYLHGGGYAIGSINTHRGLAGRISEAADMPVLVIDYRLAPEHPHPAAVEDAVAAYRWLLAQGLKPERLVIAGDSAGGGLTVATLVALKDAGEPLPACAVPISPWVDMEVSGESCTTRADVDPMVTPDALKRMADWYMNGQDLRAPLASPIHADLSGLPPLLVQVGDAEVLLDDAQRLVERSKAAGVDATCEVADECIHVWHVFPGVPESDAAVARLGEFVKGHVQN
jgi:epsilon-lactone hydrolase